MGGERCVQEVFVRREVISAASLRELTRPSDLSGWCQTLSHLGALGVSGTLLWRLWGSAGAIPASCCTACCSTSSMPGNTN
jgi:hypothetical protein